MVKGVVVENARHEGRIKGGFASQIHQTFGVFKTDIRVFVDAFKIIGIEVDFVDFFWIHPHKWFYFIKFFCTKTIHLFELV